MDKKMKMAYLLGMAHSNRSGEHNSISLGRVSEDWKDYTIVRFGSDNFGPDAALYYEGNFGERKVHACMLRLEYGFDIEHMVHLITQAIECHKAELRNT